MSYYDDDEDYDDGYSTEYVPAEEEEEECEVEVERESVPEKQEESKMECGTSADLIPPERRNLVFTYNQAEELKKFGVDLGYAVHWLRMGLKYEEILKCVKDGTDLRMYFYREQQGSNPAETEYNIFCLHHPVNQDDTDPKVLEYIRTIEAKIQNGNNIPVESPEFWRELERQKTEYKSRIRDETENIQCEIDNIEDALDMVREKYDALQTKARKFAEYAENDVLSPSSRDSFRRQNLAVNVKLVPIINAIVELDCKLELLAEQKADLVEKIKDQYPLLRAMGELADMIPSVDIPKDNSTASFEEIPGEDILCVAGPSAVGKSTLGIDIAIPGCAKDTGRNRVLYIAADDSRRIIEPKFERALANLPPEVRAKVRRNFALVPISIQYDILDDDGVKKFHRVIRKILRLRGFRKNEMALIVLDTLRRFHGASENSDDNAKKLIDAMQGIVDDTGASVMFIHHTTKASRQNGGDDATAIRGSSVLVDNIKNVILLVPMTGREAEKLAEIHGGTQIPISDRRLFVRKIHVKRNDCGVLPEVWLKRDADGTLMPVDVREKGGVDPAGIEAAPVESGGKGKPRESGKVSNNQSFV